MAPPRLLRAVVQARRVGFVGVNQHYLYEARQMQALSLSVHIPLVCFGIAFPVLVLFAEYRYLRTGDELYRTLGQMETDIFSELAKARAERRGVGW